MRRVALISLLSLLLGTISYGAEPDYERLADAVHIAENGKSLKLGLEQYGIHSIPYRDEAHARQICIRTLKHAYRDHTGDYLTFLSKRYCPVNHKVWLKNVRYYYEKG